MPFQPVIRIIS